jgi:hypothetical protein
LDAVADEFARLAPRGRGNPHGGQELAAEQQRQPLGVDAIILEASGGDGFGLLGVREARVVTELLEEVHEPPPSPRGFDGDRRVGREFGEEFLKLRGIVGKSLLPDSPVLSQDRDLRTAFVQSTPTCTIAVASCLREDCGPL